MTAVTEILPCLLCGGHALSVSYGPYACTYPSPGHELGGIVGVRDVSGRKHPWQGVHQEDVLGDRLGDASLGSEGQGGAGGNLSLGKAAAAPDAGAAAATSSGKCDLLREAAASPADLGSPPPQSRVPGHAHVLRWGIRELSLEAGESAPSPGSCPRPVPPEAECSPPASPQCCGCCSWPRPAWGPPACDPRSRPGARAGGIVGGRDVSGRKYPWQVSLRFYDQSSRQWEHVCGGSLVHPQWLLTAAHCVEPERVSPDAFRVQLREQHLYYGDRLLPVGRVLPHPGYYSAQEGADIALLGLRAPVNLSGRVQPLRLPPAAQAFPAGTPCWVTGWGDVSDDEPLPPPYPLRQVKVPVVDNGDCDAQYHSDTSTGDSVRIVRDDMMCAGRAGRDSCQVVTPGPLVCRWSCPWLQVGAVSWGHFCAHQGLPGVHTRVTSCVAWVPTTSRDVLLSWHQIHSFGFKSPIWYTDPSAAHPVDMSGAPWPPRSTV
nr:tryptase-2-like [Dasypus novemcinctus]